MDALWSLCFGTRGVRGFTARDQNKCSRSLRNFTFSERHSKQKKRNAPFWIRTHPWQCSSSQCCCNETSSWRVSVGHFWSSLVHYRPGTERLPPVSWTEEAAVRAGLRYRRRVAGRRQFPSQGTGSKILKRRYWQACASIWKIHQFKLRLRWKLTKVVCSFW